MDLTRTGVRALAGACALSLLLAACGGDDDGAGTADDTTEQEAEAGAADDGTTTEAAGDEPTTTEDDGTTTTEAEEPADPGDGSGEGSGDGTEGDPDAVALAERINLTIDDLGEGWTETPPADDDGGPNLDDCFVETDIEAATVGEAETGAFSLDAEGGAPGQLVTMQTVVLDSADTAAAIAAEAGGDAFITCAEDLFVGSFGEGSASLSVLPDDPPYTEESFGLAGDIAVPVGSGEPANGVMDLHLFRTGEVVSFTATVDLADIGIEATLGELYPVVADRHAAELG